MSKSHSRSILAILALCLLTLAGGLLLGGKAHGTASFPDQVVNGSDAERLVVRIYYDTPEELNAVAGELDIWEIHHDLGYAVAMVQPAERDWLESLGYKTEIDAEKSAAILAPLDPRYYYYDDSYPNSNGYYMVNFLQGIASSYPEITRLDNIGTAWEGENGGYDRYLYVMRVTNEDPAYGSISSKPVFFLMANIHAREVTTPEMAIRYLKYLTSGHNGLGGYNIDPDVTWLVNHHVAYILVSANPDGHYKNETNTGLSWRKNVDNDDGCNDSWSWGVDLNRNSSFFWGCCGGSSGSPCSITYRGPSAASEPETMAIQNYIVSTLGDWNGENGDNTIPPAAPQNTPSVFITLHSYGDLVLWPWGHIPTTAPNGAQLQTIGRKFAYFTDYEPGQSYTLYVTDGTTDDWVYGKLGIASYTFEIGPDYGACGGFLPSYDCQEGTGGASQNFWAENRPAFIFAHKIARTPYITSYGPDAQTLVVNPASASPGTNIDFTANIMDHRYGSDTIYPVSAAEYFIDAPGQNGTGFAMNVTDGAWGETSEDIQAVIDTASLQTGQHYLLVHGQNNQGYWGPFTAIFFYVTPQYGVAISPSSAVGWANPGEVIDIGMEVTNQGYLSDSYDLLINSPWNVSAPGSLGPLGSGQSTLFTLEITVPLTATLGEEAITSITVRSQNAPTITCSAEVQSIAKYYALQVDAAHPTKDGIIGSSVEYQLSVTNLGNITDTYDIQATGVWTASLSATLGPLPAGHQVSLPLTISVPIHAIIGSSDITTITVTSQGNSGKQGIVTLRTNALGIFARLSENSQTAHNSALPITYTMYLTNTATTTDTFAITVTSNWDVSYATLIGPLSSGEHTSMPLVVHLPNEAISGQVDEAIITITSQGYPERQVFLTMTTTTQWYRVYIPMSIRQ
ncbi:MAG: hypothetical protein JW726_00370 [Anaerolineales bacterium]|nr:hypothetical protein [Anaerolineales bacterium]